MVNYKSNHNMANNATGADGVKIAVFRKIRADLTFIRAAAHAHGFKRDEI